MQGMYSMRSPAVKRLMKEAQELSEATEQYYCQPLEDNLFEWHFTIRGPSDTEFEGGLYHGRIVLPPDYPMKPPSIILLTHNGRFETNKKICLSISGHHPESWQPSWSIRTALLAIIGFMPTHGAGALGSLDYSQDERRLLARRSVEYKCHECGPILHTLKPVTEESRKTIEEAKQLASQMDFKNEKEKNAALKDAPKEPPASTDTGITDLPTEGAQSPPNTGAIPKVQTALPPFPQPMPIGETALPPFPQPMPFGQFPMQMPFMPPFPMQANASQNQQENRILNQVPRFPLPFAAPMSPPFLPLVPPMVPGMNFPPNFPSNITTGTPLINDSASGDRQQTSTPSPNPSAQSSTNSVSTTNSPSPQTNEPSQPVTVSSTSTSEAESTSAQEASSSSTSDGPRQRNITRTEAAESSPRVRVSYPAHPAPSVTRPSQSESSPMFIAFAVIVISLIALLLLRRLYMMKYLAGLF